MSERVVWKPYMDFEKEESWLNEMAAEGWEMTRYTWCRYVFTKGTPGSYLYRIQLLPKATSAEESRDYLRFLEEAGVEVVDTYQRWVYVRKEADGRPFDLFSDCESRMAHYKRAATLFGIVAAAQLPLFAVYASRAIAHPREVAYISVSLLVAYMVLLGLGARVALRQLAAARRLEREAIIHE